MEGKLLLMECERYLRQSYLLF